MHSSNRQSQPATVVVLVPSNGSNFEVKGSAINYSNSVFRIDTIKLDQPEVIPGPIGRLPDRALADSIAHSSRSWAALYPILANYLSASMLHKLG
ncbi:hypothetical protein WAI453_003916 [Rhynchosporium graminicola]